jgi:hypothetical protein
MRCGALLIAALALTPPAAFAQDSGLSAAVLRLVRGPAIGDTLPVGGRLFGGVVRDANLVNRTGAPDDFQGLDAVDFQISRGSLVVACGLVTRAQLETCLRDTGRNHPRTLVAILFPGSLSNSLSGRDASQLFAHQFLQTTAFGMTAVSEKGRLGRAVVGGLMEHEWFTSSDGHAGRAWQGLYQFGGGNVSVAGRFAQQEDALRTRSSSATVDYHPGFDLDADGNWRAGVTGRASLAYSRSSDSLQVGTVDVGAGGWTSVQHDFKGRLRLGGAVLFQGTKTRIPDLFAPEALAFLSDVLNERGIAYDTTFGGLAGVVVGPGTTVNAKWVETRPVSEADGRLPSRTFLTSVSHLVGGLTPIDVGYKVVSGGGLSSHSLFLQGNFRW